MFKNVSNLLLGISIVLPLLFQPYYAGKIDFLNHWIALWQSFLDQFPKKSIYKAIPLYPKATLYLTDEYENRSSNGQDRERFVATGSPAVISQPRIKWQRYATANKNWIIIAKHVPYL